MSQIIAIDNKIKCLITNKLRKDTPEEFVRQEYINTLLNIYNYPKENIQLEFPIKIGSATKYADIAIFNSKIKSQRISTGTPSTVSSIKYQLPIN